MREEDIRNISAQEEISLIASGVYNVNKELVKCVPGRTLEAIKSERKQKAYRNLLKELEGEIGDVCPAVPSNAHSGDLTDPLADRDPVEASASPLMDTHTDFVTMTTPRAERSSVSLRSPRYYLILPFLGSLLISPVKHGACCGVIV